MQGFLYILWCNFLFKLLMSCILFNLFLGIFIFCTIIRNVTVFSHTVQLVWFVNRNATNLNIHLKR